MGVWGFGILGVFQVRFPLGVHVHVRVLCASDIYWHIPSKNSSSSERQVQRQVQRQEEQRSLGVAMASNQRTSVLHESRSTPPQLQQVQVQQQDAAQTQDTPHHVDFHSVAAIVARIEQDCQTLANGFEQVVHAYTKSLQESAVSTAKHLEIQERAAVGMGQDAQACAAAADALVAQCQRLRARVGEIEHLADRAHELRDAVDALSKHV